MPRSSDIFCRVPMNKHFVVTLLMLRRLTSHNYNQIVKESARDYPGPRGFLLILSFFIWKFATRSADRSAERLSALRAMKKKKK